MHPRTTSFIVDSKIKQQGRCDLKGTRVDQSRDFVHCFPFGIDCSSVLSAMAPDSNPELCWCKWISRGFDGTVGPTVARG